MKKRIMNKNTVLATTLDSIDKDAINPVEGVVDGPLWVDVEGDNKGKNPKLILRKQEMEETYEVEEL